MTTVVPEGAGPPMGAGWRIVREVLELLRRLIELLFLAKKLLPA